MVKRIAVWSGPRNLSTAMMYSFAQRHDTHVVDEPFYANYLQATGLAHPMRDDILATQPIDEDRVIEGLMADVAQKVYYQKQMSHHLRQGMRRDWILYCENVFLLRHPARVIASYGVKRDEFKLEELGFLQQLDLFSWLRGRDRAPIVVDAADIRENPREMLSRLCVALGIEFDEAMLSWRKGGIAQDGVWAPHWYGSIHASQGFAGAENELPEVDEKYAGMLAQALEIYERMSAMKI